MASGSRASLAALCALMLWLAACVPAPAPTAVQSGPSQQPALTGPVTPTTSAPAASPAGGSAAPSATSAPVIASPPASPSPISSPPVAASPPARPSPSPLALTPGQTTRREGSYEGGTYRYVVPANWNGNLVMYAHGIQQGSGLGPQVEEPPLGTILLQRGFAWAASSYRAREYVPDLGMEDTLALKRLFVREVGQPRRTIIYGTSMGGQITTASLETYPDEYQAGLAECGLVDGIWEVDFLLAYTAIAELVSGVPLLSAPSVGELNRIANEQWIPIVGRPGIYTDKGQQFDSVLKYLMGGNHHGDLPYRIEGLNPRYLANLSRYVNITPTSNSVHRHADTRRIVFEIDPDLGLTGEEINQKITRVTAQPGFRDPAKHPAFGERSGKLRVPLLTLHTTGDGWVPFSHQQRYRRRAIAAGAEHLLVQRAIRRARHCDFSLAERTQALDDLLAWLDTGTRPDGDDILAADPSKLGVRWTNPLGTSDAARP